MIVTEMNEGSGLYERVYDLEREAVALGRTSYRARLDFMEYLERNLFTLHGFFPLAAGLCPSDLRCGKKAFISHKGSHEYEAVDDVRGEPTFFRTKTIQGVSLSNQNLNVGYLIVHELTTDEISYYVFTHHLTIDVYADLNSQYTRARVADDNSFFPVSREEICQTHPDDHFPVVYALLDSAVQRGNQLLTERAEALAGANSKRKDELSKLERILKALKA